MPEQEFHLKAEAIHRKLFQSKQWKKASVIALTVSRNREVPTKPIIEQARRKEKRCAFRNVCLKQKDALSQLSG